jgi:hypothetical protein
VPPHSPPPSASALASAFALASASAFALALAGCPPSGRDVVPETHDVRGAPEDAAPPPRPDAYAYVARRPHGAVGLIGAHFMSDADAQRIVDRIADDLETCAEGLDKRAALVEGALQLVAVTGSRGNAEVTDIRFAPGGPVAANALECIVAPLRATPLPAATRAGVPALAIEATWAPLHSPPSDAALDAGRPL